MKKGVLAVVTGPSGVGKNSILDALLPRLEAFKPVLTISTTTRSPRVGEIDGVHYYFVSSPEFACLLDKGEFVEHARVHDKWYGTTKKMLNHLQQRSALVLADLDVNGCYQLLRTDLNPLILPILPSDVSALERRLRARGTPELEIDRRMQTAWREIALIRREDFGPPFVNYEGNMGEVVHRLTQRIIAEMP